MGLQSDNEDVGPADHIEQDSGVLGLPPLDTQRSLVIEWLRVSQWTRLTRRCLGFGLASGTRACHCRPQSRRLDQASGLWNTLQRLGHLPALIDAIRVAERQWQDPRVQLRRQVVTNFVDKKDEATLS
jgi:hypothetical protein